MLKSNFKPREIYINILSFLIYILPFSLLTGPFLPDFIVSICSLSFIIILIYEKAFFYLRNNFFYIFVSFYVLLIILSFISSDIQHSLKSTLFYFRFGTFSILVWYLLDNNKKFLRYFSIILLLTILLMITDGFLQYFYGKNLIGLERDASRLRLSFDDKMFLGGYLVRILPLALGLIILLSISKQKKNIIFYSLIISSLVVILLTGERTAFGLVLVIILSILIIEREKLIQNLIFILSLSLLISSLLFFDSNLKQRVIDRTLLQITNFSDSPISLNMNKIVIFSSMHHSMINTSINMFYDKPIIGHGPNQFRNKCALERYSFDNLSCNTHPHNTYFQLLAEVGLLGTAPILLILLYLINMMIKKIKNFKNINFKQRHYQKYLLLAMILSLWPFFPTQNFFNNYINIIYYLPVGFYVSIN